MTYFFNTKPACMRGIISMCVIFSCPLCVVSVEKLRSAAWKDDSVQPDRSFVWGIFLLLSASDTAFSSCCHKDIQDWFEVHVVHGVHIDHINTWTGNLYKYTSRYKQKLDLHALYLAFPFAIFHHSVWDMLHSFPLSVLCWRGRGWRGRFFNRGTNSAVWDPFEETEVYLHHQIS